jgi:hypothetical protein
MCWALVNMVMNNLCSLKIVHPQTEDKCDNIKDSFYEELEVVFDQFPKYHMKIIDAI